MADETPADALLAMIKNGIPQGVRTFAPTWQHKPADVAEVVRRLMEEGYRITVEVAAPAPAKPSM